jgi:hypothetical protein
MKRVQIDELDLIGLIQEKRLSRQSKTEIRQKAHLQADTLLFPLFWNMDTRIKRTRKDKVCNLNRTP